ncbi:MAG: choice-of-anchor D domain-containing protein [Anaerolineae bacterium]
MNAPDSINNLTILDAQSAGRVISATADVTLQGFTITGGYRSDGSAGAGLYAGSGATLTNMVVSSNWITGSTKATSLGGGAYIAGTAAISGSTFMNNTAYDGGGGLYLGGANNWISNTSFSGNTAYNHGGGLRVTGASSTLEGVTFSNNQIYNGFGGGGAWASGAVAYVSNSQVISNTSRSNAGGLFFGDNVSITSTTFLSNTAIGTGAPGGGLYVDGTTQANSLTLINNSSGRRGGGATFSGPTYLSGSSFISNTATGSGKDDGGGGAYFINPTTYVTSTTFINNSATNKGGGAFFYDNTSSVNNTFSYNTATQGAGAWFDFPVSITNTLFTYNRATSNGGGAYFDGYGSSEMTVVNSLFAANVAGSNGAALYANNPKPLSLNHITIVSPTVASNQAIYIANGTATITNTIIASHTVGIQRAGGTVSEDYNLFSDVATPYGGAIVSGGNSITGTAAFFNMTAYTLTASSAAIDAGVNLGITSDYFGNARPQGLAPDMGYTESSFTVQEMAVLGNGLEIADSDASPSLTDGTDFGSVALGGAITRTFTISNSGIGNLSLTGSPLVTITGLAAADFSLVVSPTTPVAGNSATPFQVRFNPSLIGTRAATITIANTDRDENLYDFAIQGTGSNSTPIAQAGNDQNVTAGSLVALDGSLSSDPDNHLPLTYGWQQTGGSAVTLSSSTAVSPTFTAPNSSAVLTFSLTVTDSLGLADPSPDEVVITINTVKLYLPLVFNNAASGPDLVVESLKAGSNGLTLVVRNLGNAPVSDAFWVDVYFNPSQTPGLNKPWNTIASHGAVWGVSGVTLAPGQSLNLSSGGAYYVVNESSPSFPANAQVYALVDSINHSTSYGNVQESNEANNLTGPVVSTAESGASTAAALEPPSLVGLPQR